MYVPRLGRINHAFKQTHQRPSSFIDSIKRDYERQTDAGIRLDFLDAVRWKCLLEHITSRSVEGSAIDPLSNMTRMNV